MKKQIKELEKKEFEKLLDKRCVFCIENKYSICGQEKHYIQSVGFKWSISGQRYNKEQAIKWFENIKKHDIGELDKKDETEKIIGYYEKIL